MWIAGGRVFQATRKASAKALWWDHLDMFEKKPGGQHEQEGSCRRMRSWTP